MKLNVKLSWAELCLELGHEDWCKIKSTNSRESRLKKMQREATIEHIVVSEFYKKGIYKQGYYIIVDTEPLYDTPYFRHELIQPNQRYGRLTTIRCYKDNRKKWMWECQCDCGNITTIEAFQLLSGTTQSCGCLQRERSWGHHKRKKSKEVKEHKKPTPTFEENPELFIKQQRQAMTPALRYYILKRDNFHCQYCGRGIEDGVKLNVDHIIPVSKGGKTEEDNLQTLCWECNIGKGSDI